MRDGALKDSRMQCCRHFSSSRATGRHQAYVWLRREIQDALQRTHGGGRAVEQKVNAATASLGGPHLRLLASFSLGSQERSLAPARAASSTVIATVVMRSGFPYRRPDYSAFRMTRQIFGGCARLDVPEGAPARR